MNWEAAIGIAEIVGATAVVISLIYVAIQIKQNSHVINQNNQLSQAEAFQHINTHYSDVMSQLAMDAELAHIYRKAIEGQQLDPDESIRYMGFLSTFFVMLENVHIQEQAGLFTIKLEKQTTVEFMAPYFKKLLNAEAGRSWWEDEACYQMSSDFYSAVSDQIK